jgi:hypothetical protein
MRARASCRERLDFLATIAVSRSPTNASGPYCRRDAMSLTSDVTTILAPASQKLSYPKRITAFAATANASVEGGIAT